jgi:hypothetical protein
MRKVRVSDKMQRGYTYVLTERPGKNFHPNFKPELRPAQMLALGVFGGKYLCDCTKEFPKSWFTKARLSPLKYDPSINFFRVKASQPLSVWQAKGWIHADDPRGWFQWYCRYYQGRRLPGYDEVQISRWLKFRRHITQLRRHCFAKDLHCRKGQRQALLHWAYDSRKI